MIKAPCKTKINRNFSIAMVWINGGEFGSLLVIEACCEEINLKNVDEEINETIQELVSSKNLT